MEIVRGDKKVRATELPTITRGAKATIVALRRWYKKFRAGRKETGITGVSIGIDRTANRENEINESRDIVVETYEPGRAYHGLNEDELRNVANENHENELRELMISGTNDSDRRA